MTSSHTILFGDAPVPPGGTEKTGGPTWAARFTVWRGSEVYEVEVVVLVIVCGVGVGATPTYTGVTSTTVSWSVTDECA